MKKTVSILAMLCAIFAFTTFALAEVEKWGIDKAHSSVYFDIRHTYAIVRGQFNDFSGTVQFDSDNLEVGQVSFEVKTKSVDTGIPNRDNHLRSDEFFAAKKFPAMRFESTGVKQKEGNQYTLTGNLTIKGKTNKIDIPLAYFGTRENPLKRGQMVAGFEARFSIDRLDYQVGTGKYVEMGVIGKKVEILIALEVLKNK